MLCTVLSMTVQRLVPPTVPLVMGTSDLGTAARGVQRASVWVLEPPIDVHQDNPGIDRWMFRRTHGISDNELLIVTVSRLAIDLKLDALVRIIDAADALAHRYPVRLIVVGDGPAREALSTRASAVNRRHGREIIRLPGSELDPRLSYAAADVVVGMGSSALRALSIGRPVVVQGETGFSEVFEPASLDLFLRQGFYGIGDDSPGVARLSEQIERLMGDPKLRQELGTYGRAVVTERFSLERAVRIQLGIYEEVLSNPPRGDAGDALRCAGRALMLEVENHDPRRKRMRLVRERHLLSAVRDKLWPPRCP